MLNCYLVNTYEIYDMLSRITFSHVCEVMLCDLIAPFERGFLLRSLPSRPLSSESDAVQSARTPAPFLFTIRCATVD